MDYKILQIISAPKNMYAVYRDKSEKIKSKIVCLSLVEYDDGEREVVPMDITDGDGIISKVCEDLEHIEYE